MHLRTALIVLAEAAVASTSLPAGATAPGQAPELQAPEMQAPEMQALRARGVQIYECGASGAEFAWHLKAPEAVLLGAKGETAGHHFAGPSWQANDGSQVTGTVMAANSAAKGSIPWVLLRASAHQGSGRFAHVAYIVRTQTQGGAAPAAGCDASHAGSLTRIGYSATYLFFSE